MTKTSNGEHSVGEEISNIPVTTEYALERLRVALKEGNSEEIATWDLCIRGNNDLRVRARERERNIREVLITTKLKREMRTQAV